MFSASTLFPWLAEPWAKLQGAIATDRVPQALLIHGPAGLGKTQLVEAFAARLLCRQPGEFACGGCGSCRLLVAGSHPDFRRLHPAEPGKAIPVDAIRELIADLALFPQYGGWRVVLISPAEQLNIQASNALLKTFEEPSDRTVIVLLADAPSSLVPTILSRCQRLAMPVPEKDQVVDWLAAQGVKHDPLKLFAVGQRMPLRALAADLDESLAERDEVAADFLGVLMGRTDPVVTAERWLTQPHPRLMEWLSSWVADLIRLSCVADHGQIDNPDLRERLQPVAARLHLTELFEIWAELLKVRQLQHGQLNQQLLLEALLIPCSRASVRSATNRHHEQYR